MGTRAERRRNSLETREKTENQSLVWMTLSKGNMTEGKQRPKISQRMERETLTGMSGGQGPERVENQGDQLGSFTKAEVRKRRQHQPIKGARLSTPRRADSAVNDVVADWWAEAELDYGRQEKKKGLERRSTRGAGNHTTGGGGRWERGTGGAHGKADSPGPLEGRCIPVVVKTIGIGEAKAKRFVSSYGTELEKKEVRNIVSHDEWGSGKKHVLARHRKDLAATPNMHLIVRGGIKNSFRRKYDEKGDGSELFFSLKGGWAIGHDPTKTWHRGTKGDSGINGTDRETNTWEVIHTS